MSSINSNDDFSASDLIMSGFKRHFASENAWHFDIQFSPKLNSARSIVNLVILLNFLLWNSALANFGS